MYFMSSRNPFLFSFVFSILLFDGVEGSLEDCCCCCCSLSPREFMYSSYGVNCSDQNCCCRRCLDGVNVRNIPLFGLRITVTMIFCNDRLTVTGIVKALTTTILRSIDGVAMMTVMISESKYIHKRFCCNK